MLATDLYTIHTVSATEISLAQLLQELLLDAVNTARTDAPGNASGTKPTVKIRKS